MSVEPGTKAAEAGQPSVEPPTSSQVELSGQPLDNNHQTQPEKEADFASAAADTLADIPSASETASKIASEPESTPVPEPSVPLEPRSTPEPEPEETPEAVAEAVAENATEAVQADATENMEVDDTEAEVEDATEAAAEVEDAAETVLQPRSESTKSAEKPQQSVTDAAADAQAPPAETADDEDEVCAICSQGDSTPDNLIVFCEGKCKLGFHQSCYGIDEVPPGDEPWYCDLCACGTGANYFRKNLYCCHYKNDRSARTLVIEDRPTEHHFVHVHCAAFIPFVNTDRIPFTTKVPKIKAKMTKCCFCSARFGYQVRCSHKGNGTACEASFHPMCAIRYKFMAPPTLYSTKFHHFLCPEHSPTSVFDGESLETPKRRRGVDDAEVDEKSGKVGRRQSQTFQSPRVAGSASKRRGSAQPASPANDSTQRRTPNRVGRPPGKRGRPPLRNRGLSRSERALDIVEDDESDLSLGENAAQPQPAKRARGRGRPRYIESTDDNDDSTDVYTNGTISMSARTDSSEVLLASGLVPARQVMKTTSPDRMTGPGEHTALNSLANAALGTPYGSYNGNRQRDKRITLTFNDQHASRNSSMHSAEGGHPISPAYLNQYRHSLNSASQGSIQSGYANPPMYNYGDQTRMPPPKRPSIRIKPFANTGSLPGMPQGSSPHAPVYSPRINSITPAAAAGAYDSLPHSPVSARLSADQDRILRESHDMLRKQADAMKALQDAVNELSAQPVQQAQNAMSTISSLSALISGGNAQATPPMAQRNGAVFRSPSTVGSSSAVSSSNLSAASLPPPSVQLPRPALSLQQLHRNGAGGPQQSHSVQGSPNPSAPVGPNLEAEMEELKSNMLFLLKRVNMPRILVDMMTPKGEGGGEGRSPAFTTLVSDLKQLGMLSKSNLQDYLRVFVRSLEGSEHS